MIALLETKKEISPDLVASKLRSDYQDTSNDPDAKSLENLHRIISEMQIQHLTLHEFLNKVAQFVYLQLNIHSLTIGIKDPIDKKFHYIAFAGLRKQSENALKNCVYTKEELLDPRKYPGTAISKYTKLFLAENNPYAPGEEETYNRPLMLTQKRTTLNDSIEGDYLDIWIMERNEIVGWIEISGTKDGKLPNTKTILWLELVASIIGLIIGLKSD